MRHARGNPDTGLGGEPKRWSGKRLRQAEEYCERESPPDADGESYEEPDAGILHVRVCAGGAG